MVRKGKEPDTGRVEQCRRVMVFASKGGVGKTTVASNLLVSAALDGIEAIGVDFDGQRHLSRWFSKREQHPAYSQMAVFSVGDAPLNEWQEVLTQTTGSDLAVFDMPPGIEGDTASILSALAPKMDLILIPTLPEEPSYSLVTDFMASFQKQRLRALFVLNRVIRGRNSLREAKTDLGRHGPVCPVEITMRDEIWRAFKEGTAAAEIGDSPAQTEFHALWLHVQAALGLRAKEIAA